MFYFALPIIADWIVSIPKYSRYAGSDAPRIVSYLQTGFVYPFGKYISSTVRHIVVFPYILSILLLLKYILKKTQPIPKYLLFIVLGGLFFIWLFPNTLLWFENSHPSISKGSVGKGSIINAKRMNFRGKNFTTLSFPHYILGRTFVNDQLRTVLLEAYETCEKTSPTITFVVGEIGLKNGGHFPPHRTHRNGMSVDLMTPLLKNNKPYRTHWIGNLWGYALDFDNKGNNGKISIDFETTAKHIKALEIAAKANGIRIKKIIFHPALRKKLLQTPTGKTIRHLPFSRNPVVIRHDDHYHIDFEFIK